MENNLKEKIKKLKEFLDKDKQQFGYLQKAIELLDSAKKLNETILNVFEKGKVLDSLEAKKILENIDVVLKEIKNKEIEFPAVQKIKITEEQLDICKALIQEISGLKESEKRREEKNDVWFKRLIDVLQKQIDFDGFIEDIGDLLEKLSGKIFKIRIEEQKETIRVMPVDEKGIIIRPIAEKQVIVPAMGRIIDEIQLKNKAAEIINPATEEKQSEIKTAIESLGGASSTTPVLYNVEMDEAATEYSQALPNGTKKLDIKLRATNALLKIAFVEGESGTRYIQIPYGSSMHLENINLTGVTIYFQSPSASQVAEILCWT